MAASHDAVTAVLEAQHDRLRELLAEVRVRAGGRGEERHRAFGALRALLAAHETAEEIVLRPVSAQIMSRDVIAIRNREERHIVRLLAELEKLDARGADFAGAFDPFDRALTAHLRVEEAEEFPVIEAEVSEPERRAMARWMERAVALGPSHAHPLAAGSPVAQRAVGPFTALLDHARDRFERSRLERGGADVAQRSKSTRT
ncbi:MAG TPA: hemerythrin domain-containing protein [Actinospica sp.]|jgi:hypothetical protein|nr:hemerythrin domain-containing protein [Actinospica sp.]